MTGLTNLLIHQLGVSTLNTSHVLIVTGKLIAQRVADVTEQESTMDLKRMRLLPGSEKQE